MMQSFITDKLSGKKIPATPEEQVRQAVIAHLIQELKVPSHQIMREASLSSLGYPSLDRIDILWCLPHRTPKYRLLVECKKMSVPLQSTALEDQLLRYCSFLQPEFAMVTNGNQMLLFELVNGQYEPFTELSKISPVFLI
jgi:hypothetical protein